MTRTRAARCARSGCWSRRSATTRYFADFRPEDEDLSLGTAKFVDQGMVDVVRNHAVLWKNRDRLLNSTVAQSFSRRSTSRRRYLYPTITSPSTGR